MRLRTPGGSDGGFSWQARTSPAGPQTGRAVAVGVVASEEHGTPGALCCVRARSECRVGGWGAEASPPAACALLPAERGERTDRQTPGPCRAFSFASVGKDAVFVSDGGRHRFIAWARSATEGGSPAAARAGRGGGALAGRGTARGRAPRGARQPDVRGTVACVPRRPPSEPWTPRALPFNVTEGSFLLKNVFCCFFSDI